jgi:uncharacterized protein (TIGR03086 family)
VTAPHTAAGGGVGLLERAITYTLGGLAGLDRGDLARATPCAGWSLGHLLAHLDDGLCALAEAADSGRVGLGRHRGDAGADPVGRVRAAARHTLGAWIRLSGHPEILVAGVPVPAAVVAATGALEVAVHGWDIGRARALDRPLPAALAADLLDLAPVLVTAADRPARFAVPLPAPPGAGPGARLLALLGRDPGATLRTGSG